MRNKIQGAKRLAVFISIGCLGSSAVCQINLSSRTSTQRYIYTHGGGPDSHVGDVTNTVTDLLTADFLHTTVYDATEGEWEGHTWDTSVSADLFQEYALLGPTNNASRIVSGATIDLAATGVGDIATAGIQTSNPGNELKFYFTANTNADYRLRGHVFGGSDAFSYVTLEKFNGFNWAIEFASFFLSGTDVTWNVNGSLFAGEQYRLTSVLQGSVGMNLSAGKNLVYELSTVPEPATMAALGAGMVGLLRRRRR